MRYATTVLGAILLAGVLAFFALSSVDPTDSSAAPTDGYVTTCGGGSIYLNAYERRTLQLHNQARTSRGLGPLCVNWALTRAARSHSLEMLNRGRMSHNSANGQSACARLRSFGYDWRTCGENVAWGSGSLGTPGRIFNGWMNSPPHRSNILSGGFREVGIGTANGTFKGYKNSTTYTVDFGSRS